MPKNSNIVLKQNTPSHTPPPPYKNRKTRSVPTVCPEKNIHKKLLRTYQTRKTNNILKQFPTILFRQIPPIFSSLTILKELLYDIEKKPFKIPYCITKPIPTYEDTLFHLVDTQKYLSNNLSKNSLIQLTDTILYITSNSFLKQP